MNDHARRFPLWLGAALLLAALAGCQSTAPTAWTLPEGVKTVDVNGSPMAYVEAGTGPTVVAVHGVLCDYRCFAATQKAMGGNYRFIAASLRHFYPEKWNGSGDTFSLSQHARDVAGFIEKLKAPVYLIGHSYGGNVTSEVARTRPELVSRLVLVEGSTVGILGAQTPEQQANARNTAQQLENAYTTRGYDAGVEYAVEMIGGSGAWARAPEPSKAIFKSNGWTAVAAYKDPTPRATCDEFGSLKMPVLLVTGQNTGPLFKRIVATQSRCLPAARTVVIPNAGHAVYSSLEAFTAAVTEFLR